MARFLDRITGRDLPAVETRSLAQIQVSDWGVAAQATMDQMTGEGESTNISVYAAIQFLTDSVAALPMQQVDIRTGIADENTPKILARPNPLETYHTTMSKIMSSLLLRGNAYLWIRERDSIGNVNSVYVLHPDEVSVTPDRANLYPVYAWRDRDMEPEKEIIHISINHYPGRMTGIGPIEAARTSLQEMHYEQRSASNLAKNNSTPSVVITSPTKLSGEEATEAKRRWMATQSNNEPAVMNPAWEVAPLAFSPQDSQFIEQRQFNVGQVARLFRISGHFLNTSTGGTMDYANTEGLFRQLVQTTLAPTYAERIEQSFSLLLPRNKRAKFDFSEILRANHLEQMRIYEIALDQGILTIPEVRAELGLPDNPEAKRPETPRAVLPARQEA